MHLYLATDLSPVHADRLAPDADEHLELERRPFAEAVAAAERGEINDAKSLVALLWLDRVTLAEAPGATGAASVSPAAATTESPPGAGPGVVIAFQPTRSEAIDASMILVRRSPLARLVLVVAAVIAVIGLVTSSAVPAAILAIIGLVIGTGLMAAPIVAWSARRSPEVVTPRTTATFGPAGAHCITPRAESRVPWETFTRIRESPRFLFLESGAGSIYLPKRAFDPEQLATFRRLVADAGFGPDGRRTGARSPIVPA
jgi:hypothetical protein